MSNQFRKWMEAGFKNYGEDPWFFLRELAQNSRDASATEIRVTAGYSQNIYETIIFHDNGTGMTYQHALQYLFRLYSSSKTGDKNSAGMFGIGFWSILKYQPEKIFIESRRRGEKWGVCLDAQLETSSTACTLKEDGTRITLIRPRQNQKEDFSARVEKALKRYCSYLRMNTGNLLPVLFQGNNISRPMHLPGLSMHFKNGPVEGVVGLGSKPHVKLYARGLPLWEGTTLEELAHTPPPQTKNREIAQGLAPVFLVNGNNLKVDISRKHAIDNRALDRVRDTAEKALYSLVEMVADSVSPRGILRRIIDKSKQTFHAVITSSWKTLLVCLLLLLPLEYFLLTTFYTPARKPSASLSIQVENHRYFGATVGGTPGKSSLNLRYRPPTDTWFKLYHVESYEKKSGFVRKSPLGDNGSYNFPPVDCSVDTITVQLEPGETGTLFLPRPITHFIRSAGIRLDDTPVYSARYHGTGETSLTIDRKGVISYTCCPLVGAETLTPEGFKRLVQLPTDISFPPTMAGILERARDLDIVRKIEVARGITTHVLMYDKSPKAAARFNSMPDADWLRKVLSAGAGDCDIINGLTAVFLRKMGVPARLVVGLVGQDGEILSGLHAWVEYYSNKRFYTLDATLGTANSPGEAVVLPDIYRAQPPAVASVSDPMPPIDRNSLNLKEELPTLRTSASSGKVSLLLLVILATGFVAGIVFFIVSLFSYKFGSRQANPFLEHDASAIREDLARMALHALVHPGVWGAGGSIRNFKILPAISGDSISLNRALKLAARGKLFYISPGSPLQEYLWKTKLPVLEGGNKVFDSLIKLLPGAVSLDFIADLHVRVSGKTADPLLVEFLEVVGKDAGLPCLSAPGLKTDFYDVDV
ncbi:MAG: hypothetical protein GY765_23750, partial [bacterium]|nr:hypothetical protein [bacterium]